MKYMVVVIVGLVALVTFGPSFERDCFSAWESQCRTRLTQANAGGNTANKACACVADKGRAWQERNPDREYTQAVHSGYAYACAELHGLGAALPGSDWGSAPNYRGYEEPDTGGWADEGGWEEDSGWGGE